VPIARLLGYTKRRGIAPLRDAALLEVIEHLLLTALLTNDDERRCTGRYAESCQCEAFVR
jgi:hypothetical protein